jgi:hypothetical protein
MLARFARWYVKGIKKRHVVFWLAFFLGLAFPAFFLILFALVASAGLIFLIIVTLLYIFTGRWLFTESNYYGGPGEPFFWERHSK